MLHALAANPYHDLFSHFCGQWSLLASGRKSISLFLSFAYDQITIVKNIDASEMILFGSQWHHLSD